MAEIVGTPSLQKVLAIGADANSVDITGLPTPATSTSATSKTYVDTAVASKEGSIIAGTIAQYFRGDKTFQTLDTSVVPENTNLYYTDVRTDARITLQKGAVNGLATLDGSGFIPSSQLPAIAITSTFVVASQVAMLALTAQTGDVAVRTDLNETFILQGTDATILANWVKLLTPTDTVISVNSQTGAIVLTTTNIAEGTNLYYTDARARGAISLTTTGTSGAATYNSTTGALNIPAYAAGTGTVTSVSVVTANGVSGSVATSTTTPAITLTLGAITPTSVAASGTIAGSNLSGTNTGDQTITLTGGVTGSGTGSFAATVVTNANLTGVVTSVGNATSIAAGAISNTMIANSAVANLSGTNTGDNAANSLYSGLVSNATHTGDATGSTALTVVRINGVSLAGLATGILKNTTGTGAPSIAINSDLPVMSATVGGAVPTPPNNTTTFLRGDGTFAVPAGASFAWNATAAGTTGTGLGLTVSNSASASTVGQSITVGNTQTQVVTGLQIDVGTAAVAHIGQIINIKGASTSQRGIKIDLGTTGTGVPIEITGAGGRIGSASTGGINFTSAIADSANTGIGIYFTGVSVANTTAYGVYFNAVSNTTLGGTAYGIYMNNVSGNTSTGIGWHVQNLTFNGLAGATSAKYFSLNQALSAAITGARTADTAEILHSRTNTATTGTVADNFNILNLRRTSVQNGAGGTFTQAGAVLRLENVATQTAGTLTDTTSVLTLKQGALTSTNFRRQVLFNSVSLWEGNGTNPNGSLSGTAGDLLINGASSGLHYCTGTTTWLQVATLTGAETLTNKTLTTPVLGVATATSINKVTITAPTTSATLTLVTGSSLITAGAFATTLTATATTNVTLPTSGTLYGTATGSITSAQLATSLTNETGTGSVVFSDSPVFSSAVTLPYTTATSMIAGGTPLNLSGAAQNHQAVSGTLSSTAGTEVKISSTGALSSNQTSLTTSIYRISAGSDWTTSALGISMNVDTTTRASYVGISQALWFNPNGGITISPTPYIGSHSNFTLVGSTSGYSANTVFSSIVNTTSSSQLDLFVSNGSSGFHPLLAGVNLNGLNGFNFTFSGTETMRVTTAGLGIGTATVNAFLNLGAGTTAKASLNITNGVAPTTPTNGDIWFDGTDIKMRIGGVTKTFTLV